MNALKVEQDSLVVELTNDTYIYNDRYFTLEVSEVDEYGDFVEQSADISGLPVTASDAEIEKYLSAALARLAAHFEKTKSVRNSAAIAATAGKLALR